MDLIIVVVLVVIALALGLVVGANNKHRVDARRKEAEEKIEKALKKNKG